MPNINTWTNYPGASTWAELGQGKIITLNIQGGDTIDFDFVNCASSHPDDTYPDGDLVITLTPSAVGPFSIQADGISNNPPEPNPATFGCWSITGVTALNPTVEQGGSQTISWTENKGGLTWPALTGLSGRDGGIGNTVDIFALGGRNGVAFTMPNAQILGSFDILSIQYGTEEGELGFIDWQTTANNVCIVLPAKPTGVGAVVNGANIDVTWTNAAIGNDGLNKIRWSLAANMGSPTEVTAATAATSKALTGLDLGVDHWVQVAASDDVSTTQSGWTTAVKVDAVGAAGSGGFFVP